MEFKKLNNGIEIPMLGLGTYKIGNNDNDVYRSIRRAIDIGYRHIDTATLYLNEKPVGKAIRESGIPREDIFVTTKLWGSDILDNNIQKAFEESLLNLGLDYLDLYLVHWPVKEKLVSTWKEMEKLFDNGKVRAIGLSNHLIHHMEEVLESASIYPVVNQMELHPYLIQKEITDFCRRYDIIPQAWSPLGSSKVPLLQDENIKNIGDKYNKTTAQVVLRWNIQNGIVAIPKSSSPERQAENFNIFDFKLDKEDIKRINMLDRNHRTGAHPDHIEF